MPKRRPLAPAAPWVELTLTQKERASADPALLLEMFGRAQWIRSFEERVLDLAGRGLVHGPAHSSIGQEGGAIGSVLPLRSDDYVNGSHRGHHQFLAKAFGHVLPTGTGAVLPDLTADVRTVLRRTLAEICGLADGYCRGRGGSMHLQWREAGAMGTNAIVGGGVPQAAGFAHAMRFAGTDAVSVTYFGDGAVNIGSVLETLNLAAAWKLPVCFFIENNQYAVSTPVAAATAETRLAARGLGFAIPSWSVDGMDPLAVHAAMSEALDHMRAGNGPTIIEADVYRYFHQNGPYPGSAFGYREKGEEAAWRERDPIARLRADILARGLVDEAALDAFVEHAETTIREIADELLEPVPGGKPDERRIRAGLWPDPGFVDVGVRGDLSELEGVHYAELDPEGEVTERRFIDVVSDVMARRMETDERVVVLGEDVDGLKGGTNGATRAPLAAFPDRVLGTPISENAFTGLAGGMALDGRVRPVVEFMYADFMWVAADQLFNQVAKARHMFGGDSAVPFVLRSKLAAGTGYGSQHSMDPAGVLTTAPGLRVVAPSTPYDYAGLMNTALACDDPVVVLEHVDLYATSGPMPADGDLDHHLPVGRAAVRRHGDQLTIISYLSMVGHTLEALDHVPEVDADLIDLRWLDRASLDWETIEESVRRTNRVLIVEQGAVGTSYGAWLADEIGRRLFDWLDAPIERVHGGTASPSISKVLERAAIARTEEVVTALRSVASELSGSGE